MVWRWDAVTLPYNVRCQRQYHELQHISNWATCNNLSQNHSPVFKWQFSTSHRINTPQPITKNFVTCDYIGDNYVCAKLGAHPSTGGFWANEWNITKIIFIYALFEELTYRSDTSADFHAWWLKRRAVTQGCAFLGIFHIAPHLWVKNPNFGV